VRFDNLIRFCAIYLSQSGWDIINRDRSGDAMTIFVDSAIIEEIQQAASWGWIGGATTNPSLLAKSPLPPRETLIKMAEIVDGYIFYQLTAPTLEGMQQEALAAHRILEDQLVLKIPATTLGFQAAARLSDDYACGITAIFSPEQALLAHACGVRYAIYYHNRAKQWMSDGAELGSKMMRVLSGCEGIEVLAASFKSKQEVFEAASAGVKHLSIKFDLLKSLADNEFSQKAVADFNATGCGIV
jgi:transaldolase